jgi:hypothetical protein
MFRQLKFLILASLLTACAENKIIETTRVVDTPVYIRSSNIYKTSESRINQSFSNSQHCNPHQDSDLYKTEARIRRDLSQIGVSEDAIRREILKTRAAVCGN